MSDGFEVDVETVRQAARSFDREKQAPNQLGRDVQSPARSTPATPA